MVPGLELEVPKLAAGKCDMVLDIHFDEKRRVIRTPVTIRDVRSLRRSRFPRTQTVMGQRTCWS